MARRAPRFVVVLAPGGLGSQEAGERGGLDGLGVRWRVDVIVFVHVDRAPDVGRQ